MNSKNYWSIVWKEYKRSKTGMIALCALALFFLVGVYAPLLASSKPLFAMWNGSIYFPLFRYLFYPGFYTKPIDLFFNLCMFTVPVSLIGIFCFKRKMRVVWMTGVVALQCSLFVWIASGKVKDPTYDPELVTLRKQALEQNIRFYEDPLLAPLSGQISWPFELNFLSDYAQLNQLVEYSRNKAQHGRLHQSRSSFFKKTKRDMPTLWHVWQKNTQERLEQLHDILVANEKKYLEAREALPQYIEAYRPFSHTFIMAKYAVEHAPSELEKSKAKSHLEMIVNEASQARIPLAKARQTIQAYQKALNERNYLLEKKEWLESESQRMSMVILPFLRQFHWEEDAGGSAETNQYLPWSERTRTNRKDLLASLLFGIRISIVVGLFAVVLALLIGIPLGTIAGYFAGKTDLFICRIIEMWEAMPTFFMLLLVVAIAQNKSIFLVISVLGIFGWTGFARFIRSELLKQRNLPYVQACHSLGFTHTRIMFSHILPNAIPPILTLLPFSMMAAITSEAGLSFLGLGEEGSASWGVLMDEGRTAFPGESYLLWPPAILLTTLLVAIALAGDAFRDAIDPKMRQ